MTLRQNIEGQLTAARSAAETKRARGESDAFERGQIGRLEGELAHLNKINEEAAPAVAAMEHREREKQRAEEHAAKQRRNLQEREFEEDLDRHYQDRLNFYRLRNPGMLQEVFDRDVWPSIRAAYVAGEPDAVDQERLLESDPIF